LGRADVAADDEHSGDEFGGADGAGVDGVFGGVGWRPAVGEVGDAEGVGVEPFLATA
jgi:hypothetical protein